MLSLSFKLTISTIHTYRIMYIQIENLHQIIFGIFCRHIFCRRLVTPVARSPLYFLGFLLLCFWS